MEHSADQLAWLAMRSKGLGDVSPTSASGLWAQDALLAKYCYDLFGDENQWRVMGFPAV